MTSANGTRPRPQVRVLSIGGTGQNGATLLTRMLGNLPSVIAVGELGRLWDKGLIDNTPCGCGEPFHECPFWSAVGDEAYGGWDGIDASAALALRRRVERHRDHASLPRGLPRMAAPRLFPGYAADIERYLALLGPLYAAIGRVSGADVVVDSMKAPSHLYCLRRLRAVDLRLVHLVRDPRGVAYSASKHVPRQGGAPGAARVVSPPARTAVRWIWINLAVDLLSVLDVPTTVVRYESFVQDPRAELERVASFAGIPLAPGDLEFVGEGAVSLPRDHLVAGNRMRLAAGPVPLRLDEAWRSQLAPRARRTVWAMTWPLQRRYRRRAARLTTLG
jgi:Sulfotransferase family